jgi:hypothetical protein
VSNSPQVRVEEGPAGPRFVADAAEPLTVTLVRELIEASRRLTYPSAHLGAHGREGEDVGERLEVAIDVQHVSSVLLRTRGDQEVG